MFAWLRRAWWAVADRRACIRLDDLRRRFEEEQAAHETTKRELRISRAECEALANVIARDRMRVEAEMAAFARQRAENEGTHGRS